MILWIIICIVIWMIMIKLEYQIDKQRNGSVMNEWKCVLIKLIQFINKFIDLNCVLHLLTMSKSIRCVNDTLKNVCTFNGRKLHLTTDRRKYYTVDTDELTLEELLLSQINFTLLPLYKSVCTVLTVCSDRNVIVASKRSK